MFSNKTTSIPIQLLICSASVLIVAVLCFFTKSIFSYRSDALILLMTVSVLAMLFDFIPVLIAALFSGLIWNFFFIPPTFTFQIGSTEDLLMFLLYFFIALVNAVLSNKIKKERKKLREQEEKVMIIHLYNTVLSSLSHELKTPISTIIGSVDLLENQWSKVDEEQKKEIVNEIGIAGHRLNRQITNLLQMSRLDSGVIQPNMDWCDLQEVIYQVVYTSGAEKRIKVSLLDPLPLIKVDQFWLEVILQNLVLNAINYSPEDTEIQIKVISVQPELIVAVSDKGPGIPEIDLERVFDKFFRSANTSHQGSGIGLSIVKGYVDALNGRISAQNNQSGGADFILSLPLEVTYLNQLEHE